MRYALAAAALLLTFPASADVPAGAVSRVTVISVLNNSVQYGRAAAEPASGARNRTARASLAVGMRIVAPAKSRPSAGRAPPR